MNPSSVEDLPEEVIIRILSLVRLHRDLHCCSLVSKRWSRLAKLVTHICLYLDKPGDEHRFIQWFGHCSTNLRQLLLIKRSTEPASSAWLAGVGKRLQSLSITGFEGQLVDFWSNLSTCHVLRCLHVRCHIGSTLATSPLPSLVFCMIGSKWRFSLHSAEELLRLCPSLLYLRLERLAVYAPGVYKLKSRSLDFLHVGSVSRDSSDDFRVALEMPKLRWLLLPVPRIQLLPGTCNVEWLWIHKPLLDIQGLGHSKLSRVFLSTPWNLSAQLIPKVASMFTSQRSLLLGVKRLELGLYDDGNPKGFSSVDVGALLELFQGLETLITHFISLQALKWSGRQLPLTVLLEFRLPQHVWVRQGTEIKFLRELMNTSSGIRLECQGYAVCGNQIPPFQDFALNYHGRVSSSRTAGTEEMISALVEFALEFPGRVKIHPLKFLPYSYGSPWREWRERVEVEAPYTGVDHWCNEMHLSSDKPCGWI